MINSPEGQNMKKPSWNTKAIKNRIKLILFFKGFKPSKYSLILFFSFFIGGFLFAVLDPSKAQSTFYGGFFLNDLTAQITPPSTISLQYLVNQFVFFLGGTSWGIFFNNMMVSLECIFTGFLIIPIILINLFSFLGSVSYLLILKMGIIRGSALFLGSFHLIFECWAAILVIDAFVSFYSTLINSLRYRSTKRFINGILNDFFPHIIWIIILLIIAAFLEIFWSTWWVYILTQSYISWIDFYGGVYSCVF
jgi:hypothetical protein